MVEICHDEAALQVKKYKKRQDKKTPKQNLKNKNISYFVNRLDLKKIYT